MSITTKVISTGEFFQATGVIGNDGIQRDAHGSLEPAKRYRGNLFLGSLVGNSQYVEFADVTGREFPGRELEEVSGDIRLVPVR